MAAFFAMLGRLWFQESVLNDKEIILTRDGLKKLEDELERTQDVHRRESTNASAGERVRRHLGKRPEYEDAKQSKPSSKAGVLKLESIDPQRAHHRSKATSLPTPSNLGATVKVKELVSGRSHEFTIVGRPKRIQERPSLEPNLPVGAALDGPQERRNRRRHRRPAAR